MIRLPRMRLVDSKKRIIVLASMAVALIGVGVYIVWSKQTWDGYRPAYVQQHQSIKTDLAAITTAKVATVEERQRVLVSLEKLTEKIATTNQTVCQVHSLVAWQAKVGKELETAQTDCHAMVAQVTQLQEPLKKVTTYTKDDNELATILAAIPQPNELTDDAWEKQVILWQDTAVIVEKLSVSVAFSPVKQSAVTQINAIRDAWQAVIAAHQAKDKAKYIAAQDGLARSLDGLNEISVVSEKELSGLVKELEKVTTTTLAT